MAKNILFKEKMFYEKLEKDSKLKGVMYANTNEETTPFSKQAIASTKEVLNMMSIKYLQKIKEHTDNLTFE